MKLTKRNYLGVGYVHRFQNNETGEIINIPCSKEEYERMGRKGGSIHNPVKDGFTWLCSWGETVKVDTEDTVLKENEYCDYKGGYFVVLKRKDGKLEAKSLPLNKIVADAISETEI